MLIWHMYSGNYYVIKIIILWSAFALLFLFFVKIAWTYIERKVIFMKEKVKKIIKTVGCIFVALQVIKSILVSILIISTLIKDRKERQNKELEDNKGRA